MSLLLRNLRASQKSDLHALPWDDGQSNTSMPESLPYVANYADNEQITDVGQGTAGVFIGSSPQGGAPEMGILVLCFNNELSTSSHNLNSLHLLYHKGG